MWGSGIGHQPEEIRSHSPAADDLSRDGCGLKTSLGETFSKLDREVHEVGRAVPTSVRTITLQWQTILGHMTSLEKFISHGRSRWRSLQFQLHLSQTPSELDGSQPVCLSEECREDVQWWILHAHLRVGVPFTPQPPDTLLFSYASNQGWGAHCLNLYTAGRWTPEEALEHINLLELKAVGNGLSAFQEHLTGKCVGILSDNASAITYLSKEGGTHSEKLCQVALQALRFCEPRNMTFDQGSCQEETSSSWTSNTGGVVASS